MTNKIIGYDWNGCLLDDLFVAHTAMSRILKEFKNEEISLLDYQNKFDMPLTQLYSLFGFETPPEGGQIIYGNTVKELAPAVQMRPDVKDVLQDSRSQGISNIIISNSKVEVILSKLQENGLDIYFDDIIGINHPLYNSSDKADNLAAYLADKPSSEIILIGDTFEEIDMAKRFSGTSVSITGGYISENRLRQKNPDYIVNDFTGFRNVLEKINFLTPPGLKA